MLAPVPMLYHPVPEMGLKRGSRCPLVFYSRTKNYMMFTEVPRNTPLSDNKPTGKMPHCVSKKRINMSILLPQAY